MLVYRFINFSLSLLLLITLLIPILLISILILIKDREYPIFFSSRVGQNNKIFLMPKFRTMCSTTPQKATHLLENPDEYLLTTGKLLRKYSLDELPQLVSILKGDMNFVGPRPALFNQIDLISLRDSRGISKLKPGVTGWAQINGRDELSIEAKVDYDEEYLKKASLIFDIYIIFLTIVKVIKRDGISH